MTDNEIIKALKCFAIDKDFDVSQCVGCAFESKSICCENASEGIAKASLDFIHRQQAEIDRLKSDRDVWQTGYVSMEAKAWELSRQLNTAKAEAIKEFAERVCEDLSQCQREYRNVLNSDGACAMIIAKKVVNIIKKEMVGEE